MKSPAERPNQPSSKPIVALDFDDTVVLTLEELLTTYNQESGGSVRSEEAYAPGAIGNPDHGWKHSGKEVMAWLGDYLARPQSLEKPALPGAKEALAELSAKYEVDIVTWRPTAIDHLIKRWLDANMPGVVRHIYHTDLTSKAKTCQQIGAKILIDDSLAHAKDCVEAGIQVILFGNYPWNQGELAPGMKRAKDWTEVKGILR